MDFASAASYYLIIPAFRYKLLFLLLAGLNMLVLHFGAWRQVADWSGVVVCGRWAGFF